MSERRTSWAAILGRTVGRTSVQVIAESDQNDEGTVRLRVNPQNAGPAPRIHFAEDAPVTDKKPQLKDQFLTTNALRVNFLVVDPSGQYETGDVGNGTQVATFFVGEIPVNAAFLETILKTTLEKFMPDTPVTMTFRKAHFNSGHDLKDFAEKLGLELNPGDVEQ